MTYSPGDNWIICDLSGKKVLMSQSRKTWDGLRVHPDFWSPKHPQLDLKGIPDHMAVVDGRSRPAIVYTTVQYGWGSFCLTSPNGTNYVVWIDDEGAVFVTEDTWGTPRNVFYIGQYGVTVDNDGALHVADYHVIKNITPWKLYSVAGTGFNVSIDTDLAMLVNEI
jgi:hypothetical protein